MSEPNQSTLDAPKIDGRTAADIVTALVGGADDPAGLLETYTTHTDPARAYTFTPWRDRDPSTGDPRGRSAALIGVFARFAEVLIERLNRVPEKNLLAFLDLLGGERLPPSPARAPLTFTLAAGRVADARVPAYTRVAAPPPPGGKDPVEFETERDLIVSAARLASLISVEPDRDRYGDFSAGAADFPAFAGDQAVEHLLYLGDSTLLGYPEIKNLRLRISLGPPADSITAPPDEPITAPPAAPITDPRVVVWEHWDGAQWQTLPPTVDPTEHLTRSGTIHFGPFPPTPPTPWSPPSETDVAGRRSRWLRARLATPITPSAQAVPGSVRAAQLPPIRRILMSVHLERSVGDEGIAPDLAFHNGTPIDFGKPFFPFGERPKRFDTLFLASTEAFSKDHRACLSYSSARVEVAVTLANPHSSPTPDSVRPSPDLALAWECWTGTEWGQVGKSGAPDWLALVELDPEPVLGTDANGGSTLLVQGTAAPGTRVTASRLLGEDTETRLKVGADGRFAVRYPLGDGTITLVEVSAERDAAAAVRRERTWAVVPGEKPPAIGFEILVDPATQPVVDEAVVLDIKLTGESAGQVERLRVTGGRGDFASEEIAVGQLLKVPLEPGRNALLIEALFRGEPLAATALGISRSARAPVPVADFADGTHGLTESGVVRLRLPATMGKTVVNGQEGFWLRARITAGDYGRDASYVLKDPVRPEDGFLLAPASFRPPVVEAIRLGYELTPRRPPTWCLGYNDRAYREVKADGSAAFVAYAPGEDTEPALYLGFALPDDTQGRFPRGGLDLYARVETPLADPTPAPPPAVAAEPPRIAWEYWNGAAWASLAVVDGTANLTRSGALSLLPPTDFARLLRFGLDRWWLRARLAAGQFDPPLRLGWLRLNTVAALQVSTIENETLGSSNGTDRQVFRAARVPLLAGVRLEIREPGRPAAADLAALAAELIGDGEAVLASGEDLLGAAGTGGRAAGVWVRWREVPDFHGSGPADRHFVLNHLTGEVRLGNGVNGRIPPPGTSNVRLARYRTGGGVAGNVAADTIAQLKTTVPYVDKVTNPEPAVGGAEAETLASLKARVPRSLRHQDRAVTPEDLQDLALLASTEVARVLCVPLRALDRDPLGEAFTPGAASVVIVPRADDPKPLPTLELLGRVRDYLAARADATALLTVVGPLYLQVTVQAEVALTSPAVASETEQTLRARLDAFLHPLTGGLDGRGWDFGRAPHRSDFFVLIEQTQGVDHCRRLELTEQEDTPGVRATGRFLVYAGAHQIDLVFVET